MVLVFSIFSKEVKLVGEPLPKVTELGVIVAARMIVVSGRVWVISVVMAPKASH